MGNFAVTVVRHAPRLHSHDDHGAVEPPWNWRNTKVANVTRPEHVVMMMMMMLMMMLMMMTTMMMLMMMMIFWVRPHTVVSSACYRG